MKQKDYEYAVLAADNWRKNFDTANDTADHWRIKYWQIVRWLPIVFLLGILVAALGILIVSGAF